LHTDSGAKMAATKARKRKPAKGKARVERVSKGEATFAAIHKTTGKEAIERLRTIAPDFADMIVNFAFGEIYARPGLDLRSRQIATIAALTARGNAPAQLEAHIAGGLNLGLSQEEIREIIMQMAVYGGFQTAVNGLIVAQAAFDKADKSAATPRKRG